MSVSRINPYTSLTQILHRDLSSGRRGYKEMEETHKILDGKGKPLPPTQKARFGNVPRILKARSVQPLNYVPFFNRVSGTGGLMFRAWWGADVIILLELSIDCRLGLFCRHKPLCI